MGSSEPALKPLEFTIEIELSPHVSKTFYKSGYKPALIEPIARPPDFIDGDWRQKEILLSVPEKRTRDPSSESKPKKLTYSFTVPGVHAVQYWVGFKQGRDDDVDAVDDVDDVIDVDDPKSQHIMAVNPGQLYSIDSLQPSVDGPPRKEDQTAKPWIPNNGASIGFMNAQAGAPVIYETPKGFEHDDITKEHRKWTLPRYLPGAAVITLPETKITRTFFFWTKNVGLDENGEPLKGLTVEDQTKNTNITFTKEQPIKKLYYTGSFYDMTDLLEGLEDDAEDDAEEIANAKSKSTGLPNGPEHKSRKR